ncbi:MAG: DUF4124 domain-containing protein [Moraxella sp.]|uniref:DUF4124 domain-containing protein n=1 Tax=Moraxella sp. TaxID=479 RepID=UPI0026DBDA2D|nr:DUF4124 domain-containing protein [Moraxella sp.]MDO4450051.1 DUF4124 domain-containing protein [Moraxella sp.]
MKFQTLTALVIATAAMTAHAASTTVYKSVGKHGEVRYSQMQPKDTSNFQVLEMRSDGRTTDLGQMGAPAAEQAPTPSPEAQENANLKKENEALKQQELASRCQSLRSNLANLSIGGRIFETNAQGEKVYLNDQEISSRRQRHEQMISQYCSGV